MAYAIFNKNSPNQGGTLVHLKPTGTDITSFTEIGYQVCEINDSQYNDIRLERKSASYDDGGNIVLSNPSYVDGKTENDIPTWDTLEDLQAAINNLNADGVDEEFTAQVNSLKSKDLSGLSYPIKKTVPEIAEDQGITWITTFR